MVLTAQARANFYELVRKMEHEMKITIHVNDDNLIERITDKN